MNLERRLDQLELMDTVALPRDVLSSTLRFLSLTNHYFGGCDVILSRFQKWSNRWRRGEEISILDIGTGGAEIPVALAKWGRKNQFHLRLTAIDLMPEVVSIAIENTVKFPEISVLQKDFTDLELEGGSFDYVTASLFLHHLPPKDTVGALRSMNQLCRRGLLISDLKRSSSGYWAVKALSYAAGNYVVRHDGPVSVRRAFLRQELEDYAREAGLHYLKAYAEPWFRLSLSGEKI